MSTPMNVLDSRTAADPAPTAPAAAGGQLLSIAAARLIAAAGDVSGSATFEEEVSLRDAVHLMAVQRLAQAYRRRGV